MDEGKDLRMRILTLFVWLLIGLRTPCFAETPFPPVVKWQAWSPIVFAEAKKRHKLILLYASTSGCHGCQQMEQLSFDNPAVAQAIRAHYIPIRIDAQKNWALAGYYEVSKMPTMLIVSARNRILKKYNGYVSAQRLLKGLNLA